MTYVVLQPNSNTNPTRDYLVVKASEWASVVNRDATHLPQDNKARTYPEAEAIRDQLNSSKSGE